MKYLKSLQKRAMPATDKTKTVAMNLASDFVNLKGVRVATGVADTTLVYTVGVGCNLLKPWAKKLNRYLDSIATPRVAAPAKAAKRAH